MKTRTEKLTEFALIATLGILIALSLKNCRTQETFTRGVLLEGDGTLSYGSGTLYGPEKLYTDEQSK
jgi:hypothetical protein